MILEKEKSVSGYILNNCEIELEQSFTHKSFEERLLEYNGKISICEFDWGEPKGREFF
ncbi:MAG: hypothetical protein J6X45_03765 [Lachnospiraceae bacterium]|nr:hypothetical protein [Lachnospiraceae bacterium]